MEDVVARCPDCGNVETNAFSGCAVCGRGDDSRWWCQKCHMWLSARACPACGGGVIVPHELPIGTCASGTTVSFAVTVRNPAKRLVSCPVSSPDSAVALTNPRLLVPPGGSVELRGGVTLPPGPLGRHTFRLNFEAPVRSETTLVVEAVAPEPRLEFVPSPIVIKARKPGGLARASCVLRNSGNVTLGAMLSCSESWLTVNRRRVDLAPGESATLQLRAKSKRTDSGTRETLLRAASGKSTWEAPVRHAMPDPQLAADAVAFGALVPGHPALAEAIIRNTGVVRVQCELAAAHPWLQVRPTRLNLAPGGAKKVRVRALLTNAQDGQQQSELLLTSAGGVVLRVPISATGRVPKPVLRAVRKQRVRDVIGPPIERKFQIANDGAGRLVCTATTDKPWLQIVTPELKVGPGKKRKLRYVLDLPVLPHGAHTATITLATNAGMVEVPVTVHLLDPNPVLEVVPGPDLGAVSPELPLSAFVRVRNAGIGLLSVRAESENSRVIVTPDESDVPTGPPVRFTLTIPVSGLSGGDHEAAVRFTSNGGSGRATVRFRLPVEQIDVPSLIDMGDRPAGRSAGDSVRLKNVGPDRVTLRVRGEHQWLRPGTDRVTLNPGEAVSVPFRLDLPHGVLGPVMSGLVVEGRSVCRTVAVRAIARKVDLIVVPGVVMLGDMIPGEESAFTVDVVNAGEITADVRETHVTGDLEVWMRKATVRPGERVTLAGRVRVNTCQTGQQVRALVPLADDATVRCVVRVVAPTLPRVLAVTAATGGLIAGGALSVIVGWWVGVPLALLGIATGAWLFWREPD